MTTTGTSAAATGRTAAALWWTTAATGAVALRLWFMKTEMSPETETIVYILAGLGWVTLALAVAWTLEYIEATAAPPPRLPR